VLDKPFPKSFPLNKKRENNEKKKKKKRKKSGLSFDYLFFDRRNDGIYCSCTWSELLAMKWSDGWGNDSIGNSVHKDKVNEARQLTQENG
jgi:hypothetical protein